MIVGCILDHYIIYVLLLKVTTKGRDSMEIIIIIIITTIINK